MESLDHETCYQAISRRDGRFDGRFYTAVTSTGIFCRPSCPARTPKRANVVFYSHAAAASGAGYRPCRRCRPELAPGHPEWNRRSDLTGRAMRLIETGLVDRAGVGPLAAELGVSERHLRRELRATVGTGPLQLARSRRLWLARLLLDQTNLTVIDVAFAAGFNSLRQFNDSIRRTFGVTPSELRRQGGLASDPTLVTLRLPCRGPLQWPGLHGFLAARAVPGLEMVTDGGFRRNVPGGWVELSAGSEGDSLDVTCSLERLSDLAELLPRLRRVADLDTDIEPIAEHLGDDPALAARLTQVPPPRLPGAFDPFEVAVRAVVGQQVSVAAARTLLGRLVDLTFDPVGDEPDPVGDGPPDTAHSNGEAGHHRARPDGTNRSFDRFPSAEQIASGPLDRLGMPSRRRATIRALAEAVADGRLALGPSADPDETEQKLLALPGIGPWTAGYIRMRALGDPDGWPPGDLGLRRSLGLDPTELERRAERWRPWRAYAALLLWHTDPSTAPAGSPDPARAGSNPADPSPAPSTPGPASSITSP